MNYIEHYCNNYLKQVFFFCLKRTGSHDEAEELASEINIEIMNGLQKSIPEHFSAWVWKIARNRYSRWAVKKHTHLERFSREDIGEFEEFLSDTITPEAFFIEEESILTLRRELAFIKKQYRELLVAFYIEDKKVGVIAKELNLPEGTVKQRLFACRNQLKEGMDMARNFGKRSYNPQEVSFTASGNQPSGLPWAVVKRKIPKNILLEADNNPCMLEELAIELGVALPYMEEEVELLENSELLKKVSGNRFVTNFFIASKECQLEIYQVQKMRMADCSKQCMTLIDDSIEAMKAFRINRGKEDDQKMKWFLVPSLMDTFLFDLEEAGNFHKTFERKDGGNWGFTGFETHNLIPERLDMSDNRCGNVDKGMIQFYDVFAYQGEKDGVHHNRQISVDAVALLSNIVKNNRTVESLSKVEKEIWAGLENKYAHVENGLVVPDVLVFDGDTYDKMKEIFKSHKLYAKVGEQIRHIMEETKVILIKNSNEVLYSSLGYYAMTLMFNCRMMMINDAVATGWLIPPKNMCDDNYGACLRYLG